MRIPAIEGLILEGFQKAMAEQFSCPAIITTSIDGLRQLKVMTGNKPVTYPYLFVEVQSMGANPESPYVSQRLQRQGIPVTLSTDNNQYAMARLYPTNFEFTATYHSNAFRQDDDSAVSFGRRWLFTRRNGAVNFTVDFGLTSVDVSVTLNESVSTPTQENPTEAEAVYKPNATGIIHGYTSEPDLGKRGKVNTVLLTDEHPAEYLDGATFTLFN